VQVFDNGLVSLIFSNSQSTFFIPNQSDWQGGFGCLQTRIAFSLMDEPAQDGLCRGMAAGSASGGRGAKNVLFSGLFGVVFQSYLA
jgi:hypothetical protein